MLQTLTEEISTYDKVMDVIAWIFLILFGILMLLYIIRCIKNHKIDGDGWFIK